MSSLHSLARLLLPTALKALVSTLRITVTNRETGLDTPGGRIIYAFWHGKMIYGWLLSKKLFAGKTIHAVISLSEDGELLSRTLVKLGFSMIRGSSSRGNTEVKQRMLTELEKNGIIAITPDGPRGPRHSFKYGTLRLASEHGIPILFADIRYNKAIQLKSWDRFEIPLPFSKVSITLHHIEVPELESKQDIMTFERQLSKHLANG